MIVATDNGEPSVKSESTATVLVSVNRNKFTPEFRDVDSYASTIDETLGSGNEVTLITVADDDDVTPFNELQVRVIGDGGAPAMFDVQDNQRVVVRSDLKSDNDVTYALRLVVSDGGSPSRSSTTVVPIRVNRNLHDPVFDPDTNQRLTIPDNMAPGSVVQQVSATDADRIAPHNVIRYSLAPTSQAQDLFYVNPVTGDISLTSSLLEVEENELELKLVAADLGDPVRSAEVALTVTLLRDRDTLRFSQRNYTSRISENREVGQEVTRVQTAPNVSLFLFLTTCVCVCDVTQNYLMCLLICRTTLSSSC